MAPNVAPGKTRVSRGTPSPSARARPLLIGVAGYKGGVTKTTTAVHVAGALQAHGTPTLLVDGDRIRTATDWAQLGHLDFEVGSPQALARAGEFGAVVIDSRGGLEQNELLELAESVDFLLLPTQADLVNLRGISKTIAGLRSAGIPDTKFGVLLTRVKPTRLASAREALQELGLPLLDASVRNSDAFQDAGNQGMLVRDVRRNRLSPECWSDYEAVTAEVLGRVGRA
ncbi:nucleotide-binding protein [Deinococcus rufus]|uniref:AAA family ATPase n=1 Tax=Deinococcus rufus TaxID=2136097 RepID=A0ABV7ZBE0_9DEIO